MPISRFFTTPVTIVTPGSAETRYNGDSPDWDNPISQVDTMGWLTQVNTTEQIGARNVVTTGWKLYLAPSETITAGCRVISGGSEYSVDGDPHHAQTPAGTHHIECFLTHVAEVVAEVGS